MPTTATMTASVATIAATLRTPMNDATRATPSISAAKATNNASAVRVADGEIDIA